MLKIFTFFIVSTLMIQAKAQNTIPFNQNSEKTDIYQLIATNNADSNFRVGLQKVSTLNKEYGWDQSNLSWYNKSTIRTIYSGNLLIAQYNLINNLLDTTYRNTYYYDTNNKLIMILGENWKGPGKYTPRLRYTFNYMNNGYTTTTTTESYDNFEKKWIAKSRLTKELNEKGEFKKSIDEEYRDNSWLITSSRINHINYLNNDAQNFLYTDKLDSLYNTSNNTYNIYERNTRSYHPNGELLSATRYVLSNNTFYISNIDSIIYIAGIPNKIINYVYNFNSNSMVKYSMRENIIWKNYNNNIDIYKNIVESYTTKLWINNAWVNDNRVTTTYPDNYGSTSMVTENYNSNNQWVPSSRSILLYNSKGQLIEHENANYITQTNSWDIFYARKYNFKYDVNGNDQELIVTYYNTNTKNFDNESKFEYEDYITINTGIYTSKNTIETKLYPNPSNTGEVSIHVKMEQASDLSIKVMDLKGSIVSTQTENISKGLNTVHLKGLEKGMYIVELSTSFGISRTKLVVN